MKRYFLSVVALVAATGIKAQIWGGQVASQSLWLPSDMLQYSHVDYGLSTARSSAMGGAYTSLGADLSSGSLNPAGLGMYRSSELSFTPSMVFANSSYNQSYSDRLRGNRFSVGNFGIAFNTLQSSKGAFTSVTIAFGHNKLADYNYSGGVAANVFHSKNGSPFAVNNSISIGDLFVRQMDGITSDKIHEKSGYNPYNSNAADLWGGILGYNTNVFNEIAGSPGRYTAADQIDSAAIISHYSYLHSKGSMGEYTMSVGANMSNKLYLGLTVGIQDVYQYQTLSYEEGFSNNKGTGDYLDYLLYDQFTSTTGTGVNVKLGAIWRPVDNFRLGLSFHSPTYMSLRRTYSANMTSKAFGYSADFRETNLLVSDYNYTTAPRLLTGASYNFGTIAMLSVDYERVWYNGMRLKDDYGSANDNFKEMIKNDYKGANNLRVGVEIMPLPLFAVRVGYAHYGSMLKDEKAVFDAPVAYETNSYSAGVGYRKRNFSFDLSYSYADVKYTEYDMFYYGDQTEEFYAGGINMKRNRSNISATFGFRF